MKIGIDCRLWNESGVGRYIRNLVKNIQIIDKKNEYVLFVLNKDYKKFKVQSFRQRRISPWPTKFKVRVADIRWHSVEEQLKFPSILNKENLDLMHFTYSSVPIFYNKPFVVTIHDLIPLHFPTGEASTLVLPLYYLKRLGYKLIISQAAKKAKKIITVSNSTKDEIVDHLKVSEGKIVVTYEGSSLNSKLKTQNSKLQLKTKNYFLYVGNAYPHKNLERLLEAFDLFCHPELVSGSQSNRDSDFRQNDTRLLLVGKEDYFYKRLKEKVGRMGLKDSVIFYGEATDEELQGLYKNALALIMPSLMEGFGLPALEAMANKCLVLASDIPSLKETCGNGALYFNPLSIDELTEKLNMVTLHTTVYGELEKLRRRGAERVKMFSWEKMAKETLKIYEEIASNPQV